MKILGIGLKNLASLAGEYHIDFTVEPLANAGLFAITGPTGSGKSTVLDAVCLALYGTTPRLREAGSGIRLDDISGKPLTAQDARHLLRRGCDEGYAHVAFRGLDGVHYRAAWNIRRARATKGIPGQLKIERHLLAVDDGRILNTNPSELDTLIPEKVGLSFDQFTRAVLLAQSEFSAFLKANENDRGELLEKLTNTHIYSELGKAAYRHASRARKELERLQAQAGGVDSLPREERNTLEAESRTGEKAVRQLEADRTMLEQHLRWYGNLEKMQSDLRLADQQRQAARQHWQSLAAERDSLHWLQVLLPQRHLFREQRSLTEATTARDKKLAVQRRDHKQLQERLDGLQVEEKQASARLIAAEQAFRKALPDLQQAHTLSHEHQRLLKASEAEQRRLMELGRTLEDLETSIRAGDEACSSEARALEQILARLGQTLLPGDGVDSVSAGADSSDRLAEDPEHCLRQLNQRRNTLQERINTVTSLRQSLREIQSLNIREAELVSEQSAAGETIRGIDAELKEIASAQTEARRVLDTTVALLKRQREVRSASVEALRNALEPDAPCPVCGSRKHPYHTDPALLKAMDAADQDEEARARRAVEQLDASRIRAETRREALNTRLVAIAAERERIARDQLQLEQQLTGHSAADQLPALPPEQRQSWCEQTLKTLQTDHARISDAINITLEWQSASRRLEKHRQLLAGLRQQHSTCEEQHALAKSALSQYQTELAEAAGKLQSLLGDYAGAEAWEKALEQDRIHAADTERSARETREKTATQCNKLGQELELTGQQQQDDYKRLKTLEEAIAAWKERHPDLDDTRLQDLLALSDQDAGALQQRIERAQSDLNSIETTYIERDRQLQEHSRTPPTEESPSQLQTRRLQLVDELEAAGQTLRHVQSRLLADDQARKKLQALQADMDRQRAEYERWARISDLIGSQDGRTFRRIAQAYNLDLLIRHANAQLHNLARRYRLVRGGSELGLLVIDTEMGDEIRSVHSLSGGETFLVSLALALGLASMASGTLSIESLFIDEGFGSLDPESLQLAMDALDGLQAQGRKVGVISHVQDMHERVPVQIRISPEGNGASRLDVR